jgi:Carboxypeptidase regulatory-like domain
MGAVRAVVAFVRRRTFVVGVVFALIAVGALLGGRSATSSRGTGAPAEASGSRLATASQSPSTPGRGATATSIPRAKVARKGHLPKAVVRSKPVELHLTRAHGKVFDVRNLHGTVVKRERPERQAPGFSSENELNTRTARAPVAEAGGLPQRIDPSGIASRSAAAAAPAPDSNFAGLDFANWGQGHPPDTNGDVGPNYYIETINVSIGIYDKSNGNRVAAFTFNSFMSQGAFGNLCDTNNFGDPVVLYDSYEDRWMISDFAFTLDGSGNVNPQHAFQCFAVSKTGDPVNGGWNFYSIEAPGGLGDYPKFGVWPDGIYMSANMFPYAAGGSYFGYHAWALNKQQMYAGAPSPQVVDFAGDTSDFTVIPANSRLQAGTPPAGSSEYFVSTEQFLNAVSIYKFHVDWDKVSTSTFTGPVTAATPTCWPNSAPANASTPANSADTLAIRAMAQAQYSNIGGAESLWVDHTVNRGEFPIATCGTGNTNNATVRWYQANVTGGTVAANVVQDASFDPDGANTFFRFMPALAVDRVGDLAVTYTKSNSTTNPQIKYAGRLASDPLNTFGQTEQTLIDGTGAQSGNCGPSACTRWGDYSGMALDPNGCEFWMSGEYYAVTGLNHQTRIGSFHYPGCTPVGNGTLSGTVTDGTNPVSGATVSLGNRTTTTNGSGSYSFTVPAGTYATETAAKAGFDTASAATLVVPDGGTLTKNFTLNAAAQSGCFTDNTQSTFQRGVPANCDLNASPGSVVLANPDNTDAKNSTVSPSGFGFNSTSWAGQTFTPTVSGQLKRVDVELFCSGCSGTNPDITVSIRNTTGATPVPTGADLGTATLPGFNDGAAGGLKTVTFSSPVSVTAGTRYAFIFRSVTNRTTGVYAYTCSCATTGFVDSNPYTSGQRVTSSTSGSTWTADTVVGGRDLNFVTYINPGYAPSGTFVSSLKDANPVPGSTPKWTTLSFAAATPAGTAVKFQVAGSNSANGPFSYVGPDGTASTFFTSSGASLTPQFDGFRYLRYKAILTTNNGSVTPSLSSVQVCFQDVAGASATSLAVAPATGTFGGTTTLSATLTSGGNPVSGKTVSFTLSGSSAGSAVTNASGVASESGVSLAGINAGSYPTGVGGSFAGDGSFDASSGSNSLTVSKADQAINVTTPAPGSAVYNTQFTVAATGGGSGNAVTFSSSGGCSNFGSATFTMTSGTVACSVKFDQAGNANYNAAPQVVETVLAQKADQTINVTQHAPASAVFNAQFPVAATAPGGTVSFTSSGACSNSGGTFTMTSGTGTCSVFYNQAGNTNYNAAPQVTESVNAVKADQTITVTQHAPGSAAYNAQFTVTATAPGGSVSFSSSGSCSNSGGTFTITSGSGTCAVTYSQAGSANYNAAPQVEEDVTAQKANQTITVTLFAPSSAVYNTNFSVAATAPGGTVTFTSGGVCSNSGDTFTMTSGTGNCSVMFDQAGNANYNAAPQMTESVTAQKADQTINVTTHAPSTAVLNQQFTVAATAPGGTVSFSSAGACSNSGATYTITSSSGTCSVNYDQAGDTNYNAAPQVVETVSVGKTDQTITVTQHAPPSAVYNAQFTVAATAPGGTVSFTSSGSCTNSGATFTMTSGTGTCSVKYDQAGDSTYNPAPQVVESVTAQKADQTITVNTHAPSTAVFNQQFTVAATAPGGAVSYSNAGVCSNTGATFTITSGSGTCTVKYDRAADANYNAAPQVTEDVTAQKADQAIHVTMIAPASAIYGSSFTVAATGGGSGNPVTFANSSGVCSHTGGTFTMTSGTGTCSVKFDEAGDANYNDAPQIVENVTAEKSNQTIDFAALPDKTDGDPDFTVSATANSDLAVSFTASGNCEVSGNTVHLTGPGSCTITAHQAGDSNYNAATDVPRTFQINSAATVSKITDTNATCSQFSGGTAPALGAAEYVLKNGKINKVTPNTIAYWVKVSVPSGPQSFEVDQAITSGNFSQKLTLAPGSKVYTAACGKVKSPTFTAGSNGSVTVGFDAGSGGTYFVEVLYKTSAANGQAAPTPTTVHYEFSTAGVSGSTSGLDLIKQGTALRSTRFTRLRALLHYRLIR